MTTTSRRNILTTAVVALAGAANLAPVTLAKADADDTELLALGVELETIIREWRVRKAIDRRALAGEIPDPDPDSNGWTDFHDRMFPLCDRILACRPQTIAGLGVQARAISLSEEAWWDGDHDEHEPESYLRRFVESACAFAGIRTVSAEEAPHLAQMRHLPPLEPAAIDPVFGLIRAHQAAHKQFEDWPGHRDARHTPEQEAEARRLCDAEDNAALALADIIPGNRQAAVALWSYVADLRVADDYEFEDEEGNLKPLTAYVHAHVRSWIM